MVGLKSMVIALLLCILSGCASMMEVVVPTTSIEDIQGVWEGYYSELGTGYCRIDIKADGTGTIISISDDGEEVYKIESIAFDDNGFILRPIYSDDTPDEKKYIIRGGRILNFLFLSLYEGTSINDPTTGKEKKPACTLSFLRQSDLTAYRHRAADIIEKRERKNKAISD